MTEWRVRIEQADGQVTPAVIRGSADASRTTVAKVLADAGLGSDQLWVDGEPWTVDEPIGRSPIHTGSVLAANDRRPGRVESGVYLVAIAGPDSGRARRLDRSAPLTVGRGSGAELLIPDSLLSERHFRVELTPADQCVVTDLESRNGTVHEGRLVSSVEVEPGDVIQAGSSMFTVTRLEVGAHIDTLGQSATGLHLQRPLRERAEELPEAPSAPKAPAERSPSTTSWWRPLMPLITGIGFAVIFNRWQFLLIVAIVPIIYTVDSRNKRKRERREADEAEDAYRAQVVEHQARLDQLRHREVVAARSNQIGGGVAALLSRYRHRRLWERTPAHDDFASVTLGLASLGSRYGEEGGEAADDVRQPLWAAPLSISLIQDGPLAIIGASERARAVIRSLLVELATLQAPVDVQCWIFANDPEGRAWEFARWLPHTFTEDGGSRVAVTGEGRQALLGSLRRVFDHRKEAGEGTVHAPLHLVVIDGVNVMAGTDMIEFLRDGPALGIQTIFAHSNIEPEGRRSVVTLGDYDDECTFRSERVPRVERVAVSQLSPEVALEAALSLAPLEAYDHSDSPRQIGLVRFTELADVAYRSPEAVVAHWEGSRSTSVPIGRTMEGAPFAIDFVDGPHGLVGGMTRSGKTEFLKTFFTSLALHNHPDDLALVIIDFKGAVDYQLISQLPHVLELSTNDDLPRFERTIQLIDAEIRRRQHLFTEIGASTLDAYRAGRADRPDLPNVPRLLVVVDEFMELAETEVGKEQLGRLASFTRVGAAFGVHLMLVTQSFDSALPPQIAGQAGMRICFKVKTSENSKTVLGSGVATTVSNRTKGRGFALMGDGDPIVFQSARVANRAKALAGEEPLVLDYAPLLSVAIEVGVVREPEVADPEQDLYWLVEVIGEAAARTRTGEATIPWPRSLHDSVDLADLIEAIGGAEQSHRPSRGGSGRGDIGIGLSDDPTNQRIVPLSHRLDESVVAFAGSAPSGHHEAVITTAVAAAVQHHPDTFHVYGIDLIGVGLGRLEHLPHVGSVASRDEATAKRLLTWLLSEASRRKSVIGSMGLSSFEAYRAQGRNDLPRILVCVTGADRLTQAGEQQSSPLTAPLTRLVNEVAGTGIQMLVSGNVPFLAGRFGSAAERRLIFATNDPGDYPLSFPRQLRGLVDRPGRCFDSASGLVSQVGGVGLEDGLEPQEVFKAIGQQMTRIHGRMGRPPQRFRQAPWPILPGALDNEMLHPDAQAATMLPLGITPENEQPIWLDPMIDGRSFRVVGDRKSGRSNALAWLALMARARGWEVVVGLVNPHSNLARVPDLDDVVHPFERLGAEIDARGSAETPRLAVIDDIHRLPDDYRWADFVGPAREAGWVLAFAGTADAVGRSRLTSALDSSNGVVLMPRRTRDTSGLGVSDFDDGWLLDPRAGIGVAAIASEAHRIQFPLVVPQ